MRQYEEHFICQCFLKPELIYASDVQPEDFSDLRNRSLFTGLKKMSDEGQDINILTAKHEMPSLDASFLAEITSLTPTAANYEHYVKAMKKATNVTRLDSLIKEAHELMVDGKATEAKDRIESGLMEINFSQTGWKTKTAMEVMLATTERLEERFRNQGKLPGIETGFTMLNDYTLGFQPRLLYLFAARPSRGKTALMLNLAEAASRTAKVGIINTESANEEMGVRLISSMTGIDSQRLSSGFIKQSDFPRMSEAAGKISERGTLFYDEPNASLETVLTQMKVWVRKEGVKIIFVDYIQNVAYNEKNTERENIGHVSTKLKAAARSLNIPVVALAQLRRESDGMFSRPTQKDLLGSGKLEQDADTIGLIWWHLLNKEEYKQGERPEFQEYLLMDKVRDGATGDIRMVFDRKTVTFKEKS